MLKKIIIPCLFFFFLSSNLFAQSGSQRSEIEAGIMAGPVFFKSDYGSRGDAKNFTNNNGFNVGVFYYLPFIENSKTLRENFKLRLDVSYMKSNFEHYGEYVDPSKTSLIANQLRAMHGSTSTVGLGVQMEYYPFKTADYNTSKLSPYISLGGLMSYYSSKVQSDLGPIGSPLSTPTKYLNGVRNESHPVFSVSSSVGVRYKLDDSNSIIFDSRLQYYSTDWVDGVNPDKNIYSENKANDYLISFNFGYAHYFN